MRRSRRRRLFLRLHFFLLAWVTPFHMHPALLIVLSGLATTFHIISYGLLGPILCSAVVPISFPPTYLSQRSVNSSTVSQMIALSRLTQVFLAGLHKGCESLTDEAGVKGDFHLLGMRLCGACTVMTFSSLLCNASS